MVIRFSAGSATPARSRVNLASTFAACGAAAGALILASCSAIAGFDDGRHIDQGGDPDSGVAARDGSSDPSNDASKDPPKDASNHDVDSAGASTDASNGGDVDAQLPCSAPTADFYVGGTHACSFTTITQAIAAARKSSASARTIHVAPGAYSAKNGETFPLDLRGGISLDGTGATAAETAIVGLGVLDHSIEQGELSAPSATIVTGDTASTSHVSNVRFIPSETGSVIAGIAVYCDRGNAVSNQTTQPAPNLLVDGIIVEHGYQTGVLISNSTYPKSGCNAKLTSSTFNSSWTGLSWSGASVGGCDTTPSSAPTALIAGDGTEAHANNFGDLGDGHLDFGGLGISSCAATVDIRGNHFSTGEAGVYADSTASTHIAIVGNTFFQQASGGIYLRGASVVDDISNNRFEASDHGGIWANANASIKKARNNVFIGNMYGVSIVESTVTGVFDFGTQTSPGGNEFRCNSGLNGANVGYDFAQPAPLGAGGFVTAYGNFWDHSPPTATPTASPGVDVLLPPSGAVPDVGGGTLSTSACPSGRVAGP